MKDLPSRVHGWTQRRCLACSPNLPISCTVARYRSAAGSQTLVAGIQNQREVIGGWEVGQMEFRLWGQKEWTNKSSIDSPAWPDPISSFLFLAHTTFSSSPLFPPTSAPCFACSYIGKDVLLLISSNIFAVSFTSISLALLFHINLRGRSPTRIELEPITATGGGL